MTEFSLLVNCFCICSSFAAPAVLRMFCVCAFWSTLMVSGFQLDVVCGETWVLENARHFHVGSLSFRPLFTLTFGLHSFEAERRSNSTDLKFFLMFLALAVSFTPPTHLHLHPHTHTHKQWLTAGHRGGGEASGCVLMCLEVFKCLISAAGLHWASVQRPTKHHFLLANREVLSMSCLPDVLSWKLG